uniref:Uncharacterized protein n=1 Tax=Arundo donax TaxID=35708 RepID=A0A0A9BWH2_ARUDO
MQISLALLFVGKEYTNFTSMFYFFFPFIQFLFIMLIHHSELERIRDHKRC